MKFDFDQAFPTINTVTSTGTIRQLPEDFQVTELNDITFTGSGEHWWLCIEKVNSNTAWTATQIASACKVPARQVGYAGLKDRHAVTQQWFSVQLPKINDLAIVQEKLPAEIKIIANHWHQSKIKTGQLKHNQFNLAIRDFKGDKAQIEHNIKTIKNQGVPNYFGPQRFGHQMGNIIKAQDWFSDKIKVNNKNLRGLLISTARSHIFNLITAHRIKHYIWNKAIPGDLIQLNGSHSWFPSTDATDTELDTRLIDFDVHITAALWGEDPVQSSSSCAALEQTIADEFPIYHQGFSKLRVKQDRRGMRINPIELKHTWQGDQLQLSFKLLPGAYATGVLREIVAVTDASFSDAE